MRVPIGQGAAEQQPHLFGRLGRGGPRCEWTCLSWAARSSAPPHVVHVPSDGATSAELALEPRARARHRQRSILS